MSNKDFLKEKISLISKDKQRVFKDFVGPLNEMIEQGETRKKVKVPADGNWFTLSFDAIELEQDRLVISAERIDGGVKTTHFDPRTKRYIVAFKGTRAAYLMGFYESHHTVIQKPYISWDVRAYANHPKRPNVRVYVRGFRAHREIRKLIKVMEHACGTTNIVNRYINDNLFRFQSGIRGNLSPQQIEKRWSHGMMEDLGYKHVEAFDTGAQKGQWSGVEVHWCKREQNLVSV